jgi:beta-glucosidase
MAQAITFPDHFIWGVATASYQIEGATEADGRKPSIWDTFSATPGKVVNGDTGAVACDHYHRWQDDIALMRDQLGIANYRFSIAWPRILPDGAGTVNEAGLDFYDKLVDGLLDAGITPWATLYHWDLPQALQDQGGWPNRATVDAYLQYADVVTKRLGDRVKQWMTFNEPWVFTYIAYAIGQHAPGISNWSAFLGAAHHVLLANGHAESVIKNNSSDAQVGIVLNLTWADPATDSEADQNAANRVMSFQNRWFLDPIYRGKYPSGMLAWYTQAGLMPQVIQEGDLAIINNEPDFLGINYYTREVIAHKDDGGVLHIRHVKQPGEHTEMGWEVAPESIYKVLKWTTDHYEPENIYITENGAAFDDTVDDNGAVHDPRRINFYQQYIANVHRALQEDVPLQGYFAWSLMDNFEWAEGYTKRFGLTYIDYDTQQRILKDSGKWYAEMIKTGHYTLPDS